MKSGSTTNLAALHHLLHHLLLTVRATEQDPNREPLKNNRLLVMRFLSVDARV